MIGRVSERNWIEITQRVRDLEALVARWQTEAFDKHNAMMAAMTAREQVQAELTALQLTYADLLVQMGNAVKPC